MSGTNTLEEVRWRIRKAIRQSDLSGVNRTEFQIFICNWGQENEDDACSVSKSVRDMFRKKQRNAFLLSDVDALFDEDIPREEILRQIGRTSDVVFIIYNRHNKNDQIGQPADVILTDITPNHPEYIRKRIRPLSFHSQKKVSPPTMPGDWTTTQPRVQDVETLFKRARAMAATSRESINRTAGEFWYNTSE